MGQNITKLQIDSNISYEGQVLDNIPNGKGTLTFKISNIINDNKLECALKQEDSQKQPNKQNMIVQGMFKKGELIHAKFQHRGVEYIGEIRRGQVSGIGRLVEKKSGNIWEGEFQGGQLVKGKISKQGQYECKGCFAEQVNSTKKQRRQSKQNYQSSKAKIFSFYGSQNEFCWIENKQKLEGNFEDGELSGMGNYSFSNGDVYRGEFKNGFFQGKGEYYSKSTYFKSLVGNFHKSRPDNINGQDENSYKILFNNQDQYQGQLTGGQMHDKNATYTFSDGVVYKGSLHQGRMSGDCEITYCATSQLQKYKGQISDGMLNGLGVLEYKNGVILKGYFLNNMKNGPCLLVYGQRMWKCLYIMDQLEGDLNEVTKSI